MSRNTREQWRSKKRIWRGTHRVMDHRVVTAHPGSKPHYRHKPQASALRAQAPARSGLRGRRHA